MNEVNQMRSEGWNPPLLQSLRAVGDPLTDPLVEALYAESGNAGLAELNRFCQTWNAPIDDLAPGPVRAFFEAPVAYPGWFDEGKVARASGLFYGAAVETILTLLLKSFPQIFGDPPAAEVFYRSDVFNPRTILRFTIEVTQLIFDLMQPGNLSVSPRKALGVIALEKLRMHHSIIRHYTLFHPKPAPWDPAQGVPINQEDLAFGVWGLGIYDIDGFRKLELGLTQQDEEATLMVWKAIGFHLGLDERLQPADIPEARRLLEAISVRQVRPSSAGVILTRQLLETMQSFLPFFLKPLPILLMRGLMGPEFVALLAVPRPRGWLWPAEIVFFLLKLFVKEMSLLRRLLRPLSRKFLNGIATAQGRQGKRGPFRVPAEIAQKYGYRPGPPGG
jgi:hypothetical protein